MQIKTIGIIGFGAFGKLMHEHLKDYFEVRVYDKSGECDTLEKTAQSDVVVFAVPVQTLESAAQDAKQFIAPNTLIADVTSVKVLPTTILKKYFPDNPLLATHPIFGPQSVKKNGGVLSGLTIAITETPSENQYAPIKKFLTEKLALKVVEISSEEHDKNMALVQGLTHFIGRALKHMDIDYCDIGTESYNQLVELKNLLKNDSWELFETIQNNNPYICDIRTKFIQELKQLEERLERRC